MEALRNIYQLKILDETIYKNVFQEKGIIH